MLTRTFAASSLLTLLVASAAPDLLACGDKSLSAGGIRMQRALAARYPASVLIYNPAGSKLQGAARELNLLDTLRKVGHQYREVTTAQELQASLASGQYNIVLAHVAEARDLQPALAPSRVALIAVAYQLSDAEAAEAATVWRFLIKAPSLATRYLTTIADAVRSTTGTPRKA
ncbi:MAG TPA: hypothetical protein VL263_17180 [Vicinamibacterales bacterium]|jgi:hypothetical protein|nr:hypothetical protein [Vicinamibacterales bacterium]